MILEKINKIKRKPRKANKKYIWKKCKICKELRFMKISSVACSHSSNRPKCVIINRRLNKY